MPQDGEQDMRKFLDPEYPFFSRAWVRWVTAMLPLGWGLFELFWLENPFFGILFLAAGIYAFWVLIVKRKRG
jgi:hypothetical protein